MSNVNKGGANRTMLGLAPTELPKGMRVAISLDGATDVAKFDLVEEGEALQLTTTQALWIENYDNTANLTVLVDGSFPQVVKCPPQSAGMFPLISSQNVRFEVSGANAAVDVVLIVLNSPQPYFIVTITV